MNRLIIALTVIFGTIISVVVASDPKPAPTWFNPHFNAQLSANNFLGSIENRLCRNNGEKILVFEMRRRGYQCRPCDGRHGNSHQHGGYPHPNLILRMCHDGALLRELTLRGFHCVRTHGHKKGYGLGRFGTHLGLRRNGHKDELRTEDHDGHRNEHDEQQGGHKDDNHEEHHDGHKVEHQNDHHDKQQGGHKDDNHEEHHDGHKVEHQNDHHDKQQGGHKDDQHKVAHKGELLEGLLGKKKGENNDVLEAPGKVEGPQGGLKGEQQHKHKDEHQISNNDGQLTEHHDKHLEDHKEVKHKDKKSDGLQGEQKGEHEKSVQGESKGELHDALKDGHGSEQPGGSKTVVVEGSVSSSNPESTPSLKNKGGKRSVGVGGVGGLQSSKSVRSSIGSPTSLGSQGSIQGNKDSVIGIGEHQNIGQFDESSNENDGLHKHQLIQKEKSIVTNKFNAVNDVDRFHKLNRHSSGNHLTLGSDNVVTNDQSGRIEGDAWLNHVKGARFEADNDIFAEGASGIGAGIFA